VDTIGPRLTSPASRVRRFRDVAIGIALVTRCRMQNITALSDAQLCNVTGAAASPPNTWGDWAANGLSSAATKIGSEWNRTTQSFSDMKQTFGQGIMRSMGLGR
jgi:hypothetical protein